MTPFIRAIGWLSWLRHPTFSGAIGLTRLPGRGLSPLAEDLAAIKAGGASTLLSLNEGCELRWSGSGAFAAEVAGAGLDWQHAPITDFGVPDEAFEQRWQTLGPELRRRLRAGERLVIHCYAGLGRTGLVAARLLIEFGVAPAEALRLVRAVRPGAVQTPEQESYLHRLGELSPALA